MTAPKAKQVLAIVDDFKPSTFNWSWFPRVERSVKRGHTLLISEHGVGKTYALRSLAHLLGLPFYYISASYGLERAALEGQYIPVYVQNGEGNGHIGLEPLDGIVPSAIQAGGILMIDEFFRLPGDIQSVLFAGMDAHQGIVTISYRGAAIKVPPTFRVIGATNPPLPMYPEVEIADRALLSRFSAVLRLPFPDEVELARYAKAVSFPRNSVVQAIHFVQHVKQAYDKGDLDNFVSPRDVKFLGDALNAGLSMEDALEDTIIGKFSDRYHEPIRKFWTMRVGQATVMDETIST